MRSTIEYTIGVILLVALVFQTAETQALKNRVQALEGNPKVLQVQEAPGNLQVGHQEYVVSRIKRVAPAWAGDREKATRLYNAARFQGYSADQSARIAAEGPK